MRMNSYIHMYVVFIIDNTHAYENKLLKLN